MSVLKELFRCMKRLPNLKSVYIDIATGSPDLSLFTARFKYPQVKSLRVSEAAQELIHCCPKLLHLGVAGRYFGGILYQDYLSHLTNLESIAIPFKYQYDFSGECLALSV